MVRNPDRKASGCMADALTEDPERVLVFTKKNTMLFGIFSALSPLTSKPKRRSRSRPP